MLSLHTNTRRTGSELCSFTLLQRAPFGCWLFGIDESELLHHVSGFIIFSPIYSGAYPISIDILIIRAPLTTSVGHGITLMAVQSHSSILPVHGQNFGTSASLSIKTHGSDLSQFEH